MRPRGEVNLVLEAALRERGSATANELAAVSQVGRKVARHTLRNMRAAGRIDVIAYRGQCGSNRPQCVYAVVPESEKCERSAPAGAALQAAIAAWLTT